MEVDLSYIVRKVGALYHQYGVKSVTMDDVSRHLGISKKTLYSYVKDKRELLELTIDAQLQKHIEMERELNERNLSALDELEYVWKVAREILQNMNPSYQYDLQKYYPLLCEKLTGFKTDYLYDKIKANLIKGKKEGIYRSELNVEVIARMHAAQQSSLTNSKPEDLTYFVGKKIFEELFIYHINAILNENGRELIKQRNFFQNI